jgi:hypothetical protein
VEPPRSSLLPSALHSTAQHSIAKQDDASISARGMNGPGPEVPQFGLCVAVAIVGLQWCRSTDTTSVLNKKEPRQGASHLT